jgi:rubrerythrin
LTIGAAREDQIPVSRAQRWNPEAAAEAPESSRGRFLYMAAAAGAAVVGGGVLLDHLPPVFAAGPSPSQDRKIFNFALLLEYLQAAFYTDGVERAGLRGELREFAETVAEQEREHVAFLRKALGPHARAEPKFRFGDATRDPRKFGDTALKLEDTGVAAYNGQVANLTKPAISAAAKIVSVEGRHVAWIADILGKDPAPRAADPGVSASEVSSALQKTGFLA